MTPRQSLLPELLRRTIGIIITPMPRDLALAMMRRRLASDGMVVQLMTMASEWMFSCLPEMGRLIHVQPMSAISSMACRYLSTSCCSVLGGVTHICSEKPRIWSVLRVLGPAESVGGAVMRTGG